MQSACDNIYTFGVRHESDLHGILPIVFKRSFVLFRVLCNMFNNSLMIGILLNSWKTNTITSIFKSGDAVNRRPVCIIDVMPKLFESVVVDIAKLHVTSLICNEHRGFTPTLSTVTNLSIYRNFISTSLENNQVDRVYSFFKKTFHTVLHNIMSSKVLHWVLVISRFLGWQVTLAIISSIPPGFTSWSLVHHFMTCVSPQLNFDNIDNWCRTNDTSLTLDKYYLVTLSFLSFRN